jgi:peptide/nickel transport system ATP-binding protein
MTDVIGLDQIFVCFPAGRDWRGRSLGILGESGCRKSTLAQVMTGFLVPSSGKVIGKLGADRVSIVLQDPKSSLDPRMPVWRLVTEPVFLHASPGQQALRQMAADLLEKVGLRPEHIDRYPARIFRRPAPAHRHCPRAVQPARGHHSG